MVPWKPSFYLRPLVNKGNFVYLLLKRRASGHIRPASACWATHSQSQGLPCSQHQAYLFAQHLGKWQHLSVCTRLRWKRFWQITANANVMVVEKRPFLRIPQSFSCLFCRSLSTSFALQVKWWFYMVYFFFAFFLPKLSYLTQGYQFWPISCWL